MKAGELRVGSLRVAPPVVLAPMAGVTHSAFRRLVGEFGGVGLFVTEMLSARSLPGESPRSPYLIRASGEGPLSYQVLVAAPEEVGPAFEVLHEMGADAIDLNLGCPAPQARRRGAGAALMERPAAARSVVREARRRTHRPLTAKIRLGARLDEPALRDFVRLLEDEGVDLVAVHARLRDEPYGRKPRWSWVGKVKSWVSIPVVGNGGIFTGGDAVRCLHSAGCDGLMVGRGAAVRPWCPAEVAREAFFAAWTAESVDRPSVYRRFVQLLEEGFSPERRLGRLKEFTHYFSRSYAFGHGLASAVQASGSVAEAAERAEAFFARNEDPGP